MIVKNQRVTDRSTVNKIIHCKYNIFKYMDVGYVVVILCHQRASERAGERERERREKRGEKERRTFTSTFNLRTIFLK